LPVVFLDFVWEVVTWISSVTFVSHFLLGCFLLVVPGVLPALEQSFDGTDQRFSAGAQFADAVLRDLFEKAITTRQQGNEYAAPVIPAAGSANVSVCFEAVDELHGAVVL
jgi:hypothetical protein